MFSMSAFFASNEWLKTRATSATRAHIDPSGKKDMIAWAAAASAAGVVLAAVSTPLENVLVWHVARRTQESPAGVAAHFLHGAGTRTRWRVLVSGLARKLPMAPVAGLPLLAYQVMLHSGLSPGPLLTSGDSARRLVPTYMVHRHRAHGNYIDARCIYVIHNLGYQGISPLKDGDFNNFNQLGLPHEAFNDILFVYPPEQRKNQYETGEVVNLTKAGIICCDRILTVSPGYADEIRTWQGGFNLQDHIAAKSWVVCGILNGIDSSWNPSRDASIAAKFSADDMAGKKQCKEALQKALGLNVDPTACIMSFVGRLTAQKGLDVLGACVEWMIEDDKDGMNSIQLIIMGNGDASYGYVMI
ncbi:unnamed protein product [Prorocentrum cordatum]|uniref:Starch synthase catalytic domain-containing protein n=1 Tax=Prorocentrum cordatum TaxID=2364126 RepID=A0ABN9XM02_9DINO|nr:unnamed protein product [Polarella glacialis]